MTGDRHYCYTLLISVWIIGIACAHPRSSKEDPKNEIVHLESIEQCLIIDRESKPEKRISCLTDIAGSRNRSMHEKEKAFSLLMDWWKSRDGAGGFWLSDAFLDVLTADYRFFFSQMKNHPQEYEEWLRDLGKHSFVWFLDPPSPLEGRRRRLIAFLEDIRDLDTDIDPLRIDLIKELKKIIPRQID